MFTFKSKVTGTLCLLFVCLFVIICSSRLKYWELFWQLPLEEYRLEQPLTKFPTAIDSKLREVSELRVMKLLATLNPSKACGPDEIPNWLLKEYAELLAVPVSKIINSSFKEQRLPKI